MTDQEEKRTEEQTHAHATPSTGNFNQKTSLAFMKSAHDASLPKKKRNLEGAQMIKDYFQETNPESSLDAMVHSQLMALHMTSMDLMARAHASLSVDISDQYLNQANKLIRTFNATCEAYGKFQRKGRQTIQVNHVHVHDGSQAIVGNVAQEKKGGADNDK